MVKVEINGTEYEAEKGTTILELATENNIEIPTLCYHKALPPYGACRLCIVEPLWDDGKAKLATSCTLPVKEGLRVATDSERVKKNRKMTIELLLSRSPEEELLLDLAKEYGIEEPRFRKKDDNCIFCGLCIRMCERMGRKAIDFMGRGADRELGTPYMDLSEVCMSCGACAYICPTTRFTRRKVERLSGNKPMIIPSDFNIGMEAKHAINIPFPQAVPKVPVIDKEMCVYYKTGNCQTCKEFCEAGAIVYDQEDELIDLDIGAIVVASGFDLFDPNKTPEYGYDKYTNVITGLEFERLVSASGPTEGHIEINGKAPKRVVFVQCVGSRDKEGNTYCSRVCCMYTAKHAHLVGEKIPGADVTIYYTDIRAFGKGFEEFYNRAMAEGVDYRKRELDDPIEVVDNGGTVVVKAEGHPDIEADLVVLATAIEPRSDTPELSRILNIAQSGDGFFMEAHPKLKPLDTFTEGIYLAGCCQSPKDVPDTVAQASGAASRVCGILSKDSLKIEPLISSVDEAKCRGCGFCIEVCPYDAIDFTEVNRFGYIMDVAKVNEALCKGCGACSAACLSGAIQVKGFTDGQILVAIDALGGVRI